MLAGWTHDIESFEAVHQDEEMRELVLRMAGLARRGGLGRFVAAVGSDTELDARTKASVLELARERDFLLAFEEYSRRCRSYH